MNLFLANTITLDIETIPDQSEGSFERAVSRISAPSNYKDPVKIAEYINDKAVDAWRKTSLDGSYGEVLAIGFAFEDEPAQTLMRTQVSDDPFQLSSEADLLNAFFAAMYHRYGQVPPRWIGHFIGRFDLRFLYHRCVIHGIVTPLDLRPDYAPWNPDIHDTSYMWTGERAGGVALDELADILSLPNPKSLLDGSEIWDAVLAGEFELIRRYCEVDVETTRTAYLRMRNVNSVHEPDLSL